MVLYAPEAQCAAVTFTLRLTTQLDHNTYGVVYDVTALQGVLDGRYSIVGAGGWLLPVIGNPQSPIPYGTISYTLDGQQSIIGFDDFIGSTWMGVVPLGNGTYGSAFVTWNASPVIIPEPPTLLLFGTGLLGLVGLASFKNKLGSISPARITPTDRR